MQRSSRLHFPNRAFTLLELILALSIMVAIIAMLWTLMQTYAIYQESGTRYTENSQLVRSLSQLLDDDLGSAIQDPVHPHTGPLIGEDSLRRFGLSGTSKSLRIDVVQINPFKPAESKPRTRSAALGRVEAPESQAPELKTVYYDFFPIGMAAMNGKKGLSRSELDFETPLDEVDIPELVGETDPFAFGGANAVSFGAWTNENPVDYSGRDENSKKSVPAATPIDSANTMWAPEVVDCLFRYSDGNTWAESWDSIDRAGLPVAIEVTIKLMPPADLEKVLKLAKPGATLESACLMLDLPQPTQQRIVTYLPTSPLKKHVQYERKQPPQARGGRVGGPGRGNRDPILRQNVESTASTPLLQRQPDAPPSPSNPKPLEPTPNSQEWIRR